MKKLIYVTLDLRRALWVSEATGAIILCSYRSDLLSWFRKQGHEVWCYEELYPQAVLPRTSAELIGNGKTLKWLKSLNADLKFLVFKPSNKVRQLIEQQGWELIAPDIEVCRKLEDKISFFELVKDHGIQIPKSKVILWDSKKTDHDHREFGDRFVVQSRVGHAGSSTWFVENGKIHGPSEKGGIAEGTRVKMSEWISGKTYTVNGDSSPKGKLIISELWQQLMHVPEWNEHEMGTVGISPVNLSQAILKKLKDLLLKLAPVLKRVDYKGFFGLDLIWDGSDWYLIECNPRFTASVSLQCFLDVLHKRKALLKYHAEQSDPKEHHFYFLKKEKESFGQIILRNTKKRPWKISKTLKSGIYSLTDKKHWRFRLKTYNPQELEKEELLLALTHKPGASVEPGSDFATLIFRDSACNHSGNMRDLFLDFYDRVICQYLIRTHQMWNDRYARVQKSLALYKKPVEKESYLQTETVEGEVVKLLGEYKGFFLIEKADKTKGWITKEEDIDTSVSPDQCIIPNQSSTSAEQFFQQWLGTPYRFGGNSHRGIDCSAFVQRYFWEVKGILLPKHSQDQKAASKTEVSQNDLQDDDLIFLRNPEKNMQHVGIIRSGKVWHSSLEKGVVEENLEKMLKKYQPEQFKRL